MKTIEVVAAIIVDDGKILCAQRGKNKLDYLSEKFEFPGGKLENNETLEQALAREIREELNMPISVDRLLLTVEHTYPDFKIIMHSFICYTQSRALVLNEHLQALWLTIAELDALDWAAADIPIVEQLKATM
ncbi:(deoxy)nucleoside triphosphate pyrophosphohydrolase [Psychrobacter cibarius]|uniref:(deoxy)nucleoside triphosphate pyrophosphohydrolase n=1 Tax=Psychrobacter cibarius TaxID=282669 RepID=UPI001917F8D9|nr:(deoxy)nucleoside triphosphate pyrophosphohydrolase [Psychrobacter cibarius]